MSSSMSMDMIIQASWSLWTAFLEVRVIGVAVPVTEGVEPGQWVTTWFELVSSSNHSALPKDDNHIIINTAKNNVFIVDMNL